MGWTSNDGGRENVTKRQRGPFKTVSGNTVTATKHHRTGNEDWFLYEVRSAEGVVTEKSIMVTLWEGGAHKDMGLECHPYCYGCPLEWLDEVPAPTPEQESYYDWWMKRKGTPVIRCENCRKLDCAGHAHELIVVSASGSWATNVPEGMVGVVCCKGGRTGNRYAGAEEYRLVTAESYAARGGFFVVPEDAPVWEYDEANPHKPSERRAA